MHVRDDESLLAPTYQVIDMRLARSLDEYPAARPLVADDVTEFHAARVVLLLYICGTKKKIDGLTKLAKLDFFVRYPEFFDRIAPNPKVKGQEAQAPDAVESTMVRHHYGPWDKRYYAVLGYLESREVIEVTRVGKAFHFALTSTGAELASRLVKDPSYASLTAHMRKVKKALGAQSGDALKRMIYRTFEDEVANLRLGELIRS